MNNPYFSIIVPCYNQAHFLSECIQSILDQDFEDWEAIIINDGSQDNTQTIADGFAKTDHRIIAIQKINGGLSSARNAGLKIARGNYIQFLDADDLLLPACLSSVHTNLQMADYPGLFRTGYCYANESNTEILHSVMANEIPDPLVSISQGNFGPSQSIFIKKSIAEVIGGFDERLRSAEDWDYWMRAIKAGATNKFISTPLVCYRYVRNSMSRDAFRMYEALKAVALRASKKDFRIMIDFPTNMDRDWDATETIKRQLLACLGVSIMQGKITESVELFSKEKAALGLTIHASHFSAMYSYLSFRYWNSNADLKFIFADIYPNYQRFFLAIGLSQQDQVNALKAVFGPVRKIKNHKDFGRLIGGLLNRLS